MLSRKRLIYGLALVTALLITASFVMRAAHRVEALRSGADEPLRPWMNAHYIARSYRVPLPVVLEVLSVEPGPGAMRPIGRLARDQNRMVAEVFDDLRRAIAQSRLPPTPAPHEIPALPQVPDPPTPPPAAEPSAPEAP